MAYFTCPTHMVWFPPPPHHVLSAEVLHHSDVVEVERTLEPVRRFEFDGPCVRHALVIAGGWFVLLRVEHLVPDTLHLVHRALAVLLREVLRPLHRLAQELFQLGSARGRQKNRNKKRNQNKTIT